MKIQAIACLVATVLGCNRAALDGGGAMDSAIPGDASGADLAAGGCDGGGGITCVGMVCCGFSACGSDDNGATGFCCSPLGAFCGESGTPATNCHRSADCGGESLCRETRSGESHGATCISVDIGPLACVDGADCQNGQSCCPYNATGPSFRRCVATDGGACP